MELAKNQTQSTALQQLSQNAIVQNLAGSQFDKVSQSLPAKIEGTFEVPKVREMILAAGEQSVCAFVEFELIKLAARINVSGNLNDAQVQFIASQLVGMFPNETIADFKICFEKGSIGAYGKIFKLDGVEIGTWMKAYLEEKYQVLENQLMKEKDEIYKPVKVDPTDPDAHQKWLDKLKEATAQIDERKIPPLTDQDIKLEGQERPKANFHPYTPVSVLQQQELHREWVRQNFDKYTGEKLPTWKPETEWLSSLSEEAKKVIYLNAKIL